MVLLVHSAWHECRRTPDTGEPDLSRDRDSSCALSRCCHPELVVYHVYVCEACPWLTASLAAPLVGVGRRVARGVEFGHPRVARFSPTGTRSLHGAFDLVAVVALCLCGVVEVAGLHGDVSEVFGRPKVLRRRSITANGQRGQPIGSLNRFQRFMQSGGVSQEAARSVLEPLRQVRKARQKPAHTLRSNVTDRTPVHRQVAPVGNINASLEAIRHWLASHPRVCRTGGHTQTSSTTSLTRFPRAGPLSAYYRDLGRTRRYRKRPIPA